MKILYFMRHAKSSWDSESFSDIDRPLNYRGEAQAPIIGKRLKEMGVSPDLILCSPANRALATARMVAKEIDYPEDKIDIKEKIYEAPPSAIYSIIESAPDSAKSLLLVGHNPAHTQIFERFYGKRAVDLNTASVFAVELSADKWSELMTAESKFLFLESPKTHY